MLCMYVYGLWSILFLFWCFDWPFWQFCLKGFDQFKKFDNFDDNWHELLESLSGL